MLENQECKKIKNVRDSRMQGNLEYKKIKNVNKSRM